MTKDESLTLALAALEELTDTEQTHAALERGDAAITALREALAQPDYRTVKTYHEGKPVYVAQPEQNLNCKSTQARLATAWGYVKAQPEQEPLEYWNAVEGWVKIDEVREHFDSVGCGTIYKTAGEDRTPLYTTPQHPQQEQNLSCKSVQARLATAWGYVKAQSQQEPVAGMVLVPYEPCFEMQEQGSMASDYDLSQSRAKRVYQAMIDMHQVLEEKEPSDEWFQLNAGYTTPPQPTSGDYALGYAEGFNDACKKSQQEPVAWMHNFIEGGISIGKRPADLERHPDRWTALFKDPKPCPTCEALARTVMLDQTSHDAGRTWVGLTDEEIRDLWSWSATAEAERTATTQQHAFAQAIEAKLKEKNERRRY